MKTSAPLLQSQYGLYVECMDHIGEIYYNLPYLYILDRNLDGERLRHAIESAVAVHKTLFTRITTDDNGEPVQTIDDEETFSLVIEDIDDIEHVKDQLVKPFNIYGDRLFRIRLLRTSTNYYLFIDYHHLIVDGTSMNLILNDIDRAYQGKELEPVRSLLVSRFRCSMSP